MPAETSLRKLSLCRPLPQVRRREPHVERRPFMFQAKMTRIVLALVLTLALTSASSAVALARDQPLGSGVVVERAPAVWISLFVNLLTKAGGRMDVNGSKAGGRM